MNDKKLTVELEFHASWWNQFCGISFTEPYFTNLNYRCECQKKMKRYLYDRLGDIGLGEKNPSDEVTIEGFGVPTLPAQFGCKINFKENDLPWAIPLNLDKNEIMKLKEPDVENGYPLSYFWKQAEELKKIQGYVNGYINPQSILNVGFKIRGDQLLTDFYDDPELVHHLFEGITNFMVKFFNKHTKCFGEQPGGYYYIGNCTADFISNKMYEEFVFPYDNSLSKKITNSKQPFGMHHCGCVDEVLEGYSKLYNLQAIDIGLKGDVRRVREKLPNVRLRVIFDPNLMAEMNASEVERKVEELHQIGIDTIILGGIDANITDERIRAVFQTVKAIS